MQSDTKKVAIVVPIYKVDLDNDEKISLRQLQKVLGHYPRLFLSPESLEFDYGDLGNGFDVIRFPDVYFSSVYSYSRLLLRPDFYERFRDYEYIFIYQLDGFVFSDRLLEFCAMGYDYIGAPIWRFNMIWDTIAHGIRVGNGGVSLRRVSACQRMAGYLQSIGSRHPFFDYFASNEDAFFGHCAGNHRGDFTVAPFQTALDFAVQENCGHAHVHMLQGWRPFAAHGWNADDGGALYDIVCCDISDSIVEKQKYISQAADKTKKLRMALVSLGAWQDRRNLPLWRMTGLLACGELQTAVKLWRSVLERQHEKSPAWIGYTEYMTMLYRMAIWYFEPEWKQYRPGHIMYSIGEVRELKALLMEGILRTLFVGRIGERGLMALNALNNLLVDRGDAGQDISYLSQLVRNMSAGKTVMPVRKYDWRKVADYVSSQQRERIYFICCSARDITEETLKLHQLGAALREGGQKACMYYYDIQPGEQLAQPLAQYHIPYADDVSGLADDILILPERLRGIVPPGLKMHVVIW